MGYAFGTPRTYTLDQACALDAGHQSQISQATEAFLGHACPDVEACANAIARIEATRCDAVVFTYYPITRDGDLAFEMWTFGGDNGTVFHANSATQAWVHAVQGSFQAFVEDEPARKLADELARVSPF